MQFKMGYSRAQQGAVPRGLGVPHKPSSKHVEGQVDPEELTRRLLMVLAEQEAYERRKQRRAEEQHRREHQSSRHGQSQSSRTHADPRSSDHSRRRPSQANLSTSSNSSSQQPESQSTEQHYVPKEAARQFTRTTTVEQMRSNDFIHQLSKRAHRHHQDGGREGDQASASSPADLTRQLRHSQVERDRVLERERQQRQHQQAASSSSSSQQNHTFKAELARLNTNHNRVSLTGHYNSYQPRRNSTGGAETLTDPTLSHNHQPATRRSMLILNPTLPNHPEGSDTTTPTSEEPTPIQRFPTHAPEHRVDWSQSDERKPTPSQSQQQPPQPTQQHHSSRPKLLLSPLLKRADTLFALRSKSNREKEDKGDRGKISSSATGSGSGSGSAVTSPLVTIHQEENNSNNVLSSPGTMLPSPTRLPAKLEVFPLSISSPPPAVVGGGSGGEKSKSPTSAKSPSGGGGKGFFGRFKR
ncbi:hypothetical protein B0T21DRAFT_5681 [Apiosordaria backusii]|uniref:Uncharacterized protein n=1 Tax=Apiosordaria backusii TaxID=314023 RepID=A0AA40K684_9PEZI|nr:hypothetical protein B0T21DRAFT_5681 [Apiosordaria backusii]